MQTKMGFPGGASGKESPSNARDTRDEGSIPGFGRSPAEGNSYLFQYSGPANSMDCIVHGVAKSRTRMSDFHFHMIVGLAILQFEGQASRLETQGRAELAT